MTSLDRPLRWRVGNLAVTFDRNGVALKPFRSRRPPLHISQGRLIELCAISKRCDIPLFGKPGPGDSLYDHVSRHYYAIKPGTPRIQPWVIHPNGKYWRLALVGDENHAPSVRRLLPTLERIRCGDPSFV